LVLSASAAFFFFAAGFALAFAFAFDAAFFAAGFACVVAGAG